MGGDLEVQPAKLGISIEEHEFTAVIVEMGCKKALDLAVNRKIWSIMLRNVRLNSLENTNPDTE